MSTLSTIQTFFEHSNSIPKDLSNSLKQLKQYEESYETCKSKLIEFRQSLLNLNKSGNKSQILNLKNQIEKEYQHCINTCNNKLDTANDVYYYLGNNIRKLNEIIIGLEQDLINTKFNDFSYQNSLLDTNFEELLNFENYLINKKKSRNKKSRNALKNLNINLPINSLSKRRQKKLKLQKRGGRSASPERGVKKGVTKKPLKKLGKLLY
jgi:hypothetical protein